ncbi:nuclease-related domain-containing DEAD/DEAH box helicase [Photobacterium phosphoreum]|uniref:nuclease-related domain-containing DEAD/DEAH box helicase n=1 Tax=Photobacterium phosphoreum TaxID=659 RepID=UPI001E5E9405|nr:UvrD-helicase domain-containing protein [Photobacterium phosphoreum]
MKVINPTNIDLLTSGERYTLDQKLKKLLSNEDCFIYVQPNINSLRPDFVVIGKAFGVLIIEVKDWSEDFILSSNSKIVNCENGRFKNPIDQVETYETIVLSKLNGVFDFIDDSGDLKVNVRTLVFYTNLSSDYLDSKPELTGRSSLIYDRKKLRTLTLDELVVERKNNLSNAEILAIRSVLFPEIAIPTETSESDEFVEVKDVKALDYEQEEFAKKVPNGHYMVSGIPGSGKTVILLSRALHLAQRYDNYSILILTYTKALANKLKLQFSVKVTDMSIPESVKCRIEIKHFHKLCYDIIGFNKRVADQSGEKYYSEIWPQEAISGLKNKTGSYDAVLVDEYQDFHVDWFELCKQICKKNGEGQENLFFAGDRLQRIYDITWNSYKEIGINIQGRSKLLKIPYRTNQNHLDFALKFLSNDDVLAKDIGNFYEIEKLNSFTNNGNSIDLVKGSPSAISSYVEQLVNKLDILPEDILILCHTNYECHEMLNTLPNNIRNKFDSGKEPKKGRGLITTYHSSKGLESKYCILYKVDKFEVQRINRILMYVGMTRASEKLIVNYDRDNNFASEILSLLHQERT